MSDYQFQCYKDLRDGREEALRQEISRLRDGRTGYGSEGMTGCPFTSYAECRDKYGESIREVALLRDETAKLKDEIAKLKHLPGSGK